MNKKNLLIIEDETDIREGIKMLLGDEEFNIIEAENGTQGLLLVNQDTDLVILDVMMPGMNGIQVCGKIREQYNVPILFLTAKSQEQDTLIGLRAGGDDYLTKPFSYIELITRIRALLRRYCVYLGRNESGSLSEQPYIELDGIKISREHNEVYLDNRELNLTETEYQLLLLLMKKPERSHSAKLIYEEIWNEPYFYGANSTVMVHIRNLRNKIESDPQNPVRIVTVWGKGYKFQRMVKQ